MNLSIASLPRHGGHPCMGKVLLLREIARGGMGVVHAGWHSDLDIPVAVKLLNVRDEDDPQHLERFLREARLSAGLDEPNMVRVFDCGEVGGMHYIVMEWIPGKDLADVINEAGPLTEAEVYTVLRDVGQALMTLHGSGVVHRDIKPANLMLRAHDGRIKVADFGIARKFVCDGKPLTGIDSILGTPGFLSPEQISDSGNVGPAADLFSLGLSAYCLLTGREPFAGETIWEVLKKIQEEPLPDPSTFGKKVSAPLFKILRGLTEKDPSRRIGQAEQLIRRLPSVSFPFRPEILQVAAPSMVVERPNVTEAIEAAEVGKVSAVAEVAPVVEMPPTPPPPVVPAMPGGAPGTICLPDSGPVGLLFCQCLQNDFVRPLAPGEPLPNKVHVGHEEARRLVGDDPANGPLVGAVAACAASPNVHTVYIRDWHDAQDAYQQVELKHYGEHCLMGTPGAKLIDVLEGCSRDRRSAAVVDATGINDFADSPMEDVIEALVGSKPRNEVPVGVVGVWTDVKVRYLLYDLLTRGRFTNLATCVPLVASADKVAHQQSLRHFEEVLNVRVYYDIPNFLSFLGAR